MSDELPPYDAKPSQIPNWILVGFLAGALTTWFFMSGEDPREQTAVGASSAATDTAINEPESAPPVSAPEPAPENVLADGSPSLPKVEALFSTYREWAFWSDERTQIAVWNSTTLGFTDYFEVLRTDEGDFFRPIPRFTRLPIDGYGPPHSPILFTETAEQQAKRYYAAHPERKPKPESPVPVDFNELPRPPDG